jgi:hypothetical protein
MAAGERDALAGDGSRSRLAAAWLRRDSDTLDHLFACCDMTSVVIPTITASPDDVSDGAVGARDNLRVQLERRGGTGSADGVLAVGLYFNALLGWEATDDFEEIDRFVDASLSALAPLADDSPFRSVGAAYQMLRSIPYQCKTEEARLCACSYSLQLAAQDVVDYVSSVSIAERGVDGIDDLLLSLVRRDADNAATFYALLAEVVTPLAGRFAEVLVDTSGETGAGMLSAPRAQLQRDIGDEVPGLIQVAAALTADGEVLGGELAVQADALERMAEALEAPSLVLDRGQLIYVYPFTLDDPAENAGIREFGDYRLQLPGPAADDGEVSVPFRFQEVQRTDAWGFLAEGASEVFTAFRDRGELVLTAGFELRFRPKWIEMEERRGALEPGSEYHAFRFRAVLGLHGGHYLHLETQMGERAGAEGPDPWSGAHVDQWVRRLGPDAGADHVSLHCGDDMVCAWGTLHEFAESIAAAIDRVEHPAGSDGSDGSDGEGDQHERAEVDLVGASLIFQVDAARVIEPNGIDRPLRADDDIASMTGYSALMATTRYLPASVEEWIRLDAPAPENLLDGLRPYGDLLVMNGDVMTLIPRGSPNWVVMEQLEILEFAVSLRGYLEHLSDRLRRRLRSEEGSGPEPTIDEVTADIRDGNRVLELLRSRGLMRSRYHAELLARIAPVLGSRELDARVEKTVDALRDVRRRLEEEQRNRLSESLDLTLFWLTVVTVFIAVHQFGTSFLDQDVGVPAKLAVVAIAAMVTAALVLGYRYIRGRAADLGQ